MRTINFPRATATTIRFVPNYCAFRMGSSLWVLDPLVAELVPVRKSQTSLAEQLDGFAGVGT